MTVCADGENLQQIILNLLTNAVKFTDRGGLVRLELTLDRNAVLLRVSDTAIGIPRDKLETIFEPFVQVDPNYTRDGVGLVYGRPRSKIQR